MAVPARITGKSLSLMVDTVEYAGSITKWSITSEESTADNVTFEEVATAGGAFDYILTVSSIASTASGAMWSYVWGAPGELAVPYIVKPHGNAAASATQPHFSGTLTIPGGMPELGSEAGKNTEFDVQFKLDQRPTKVSA